MKPIIQWAALFVVVALACAWWVYKAGGNGPCSHIRETWNPACFHRVTRMGG